MNGWGWKPPRKEGIWRYGAFWLKPLVAAAPYLTVVLLLVMLMRTGDAFTARRGVIFDLPETGAQEGLAASQVALALNTPRETLVFFDDSRYVLGQAASEAAFADHLAQRLRNDERKVLMVLSDRTIVGERLMKLASLATASGAKRVLFADREGEERPGP